MLALDLEVWRLFAHVLAACVWVGGQLALVGLLPALRSAGDEVPRAAARRFNRLAWPAFAVLVVTGIWNLLEIDVGDRSSAYHVTLGIKLMLVAVSGVGAAAHASSPNRLVLALGGAAAGLGGLASLLLGVALSTGA